MKRIAGFILLAIILFAGITFFTGTFESDSDGETRLGFPVAFYKVMGGKCDVCPGNTGFSLPAFMLDVLFAVVIVFLLHRLCKYLLNSVKVR